MFKIKVSGEFSSAHNLSGYRGKCEALHGHNWKVEAAVAGSKLDKTGMLMDFRKLKSALNKILDKLDHNYLNRLNYFKKINPTSENIAKYIFDNLRLQAINPESVTVWESENSAATYCGKQENCLRQ